MSVVTYLDSLMGLAPAVTFIASQATAGDFDILIQKRSEKDILIPGNQNYFSHQSKSFTDGLDRSKNFYELIIERLEKHEMLPLVNYTWLNQTLKEQNYGSKLKPGKKERVLGRFSPRWTALSKLVNLKQNLNQEGDPARSNQKTSAIMIAGNSQAENEIGIANGFPKLSLEQGEVIILQDVLDVLDLGEGDTVHINYDLFQAAVTDLSRLKLILFDFKAFTSNFQGAQQGSTQGEALLQQFGFPVDSYIDTRLYFNDRILRDLKKRVTTLEELNKNSKQNN